MIRIRHKLHLLAALSILMVLTGCASITDSSPETIEIPNLGLTLTPVEGWHVDETVTLDDPAKGGVLLRLSPALQLSGAPKSGYGPRVKTPSLETLTDEQWTRFEKLKKQPGVQVDTMKKESVKILEQKAMLLTHRYTLGTGPAQISVSEQTWIMQHQNRGLAFVISGRTELVSPWEPQIQDMLASLAPKVSAPN